MWVPLRCALLSVLLLPSTSLPAQNLLDNAAFDTDLSGWGALSGSPTHDELDVAADPDSGSARVTNGFSAPNAVDGIFRCVPVIGGASYDFGVWVSVPSGQDRGGPVGAVVVWFSSLACAPGTNLTPIAATTGVTQATDRWVLDQRLNVLAPGNARSAAVSLGVLKQGAGGSYTALFDDARFCASGTCALSIGPIITSTEIPGFRFQVTIEAGDQTFPGSQESECLEETTCVSGAISGRTEAQIRVIGPRPNGYLWVQVVRFTPSRLVVVAQQPSSGVTRSYVLEAVKSGKKPTNLEDRTAFLP